MARSRRPRLSNQFSLARAIVCNNVVGNDVGESESDAKWLQVAKEGQYLGYKDGTAPFALTKADFESAILNLHAHPSFKAGADGVGVEDVIPWDFNHCSEMDPRSGSIAVTGAPAQGWTRDLQVRTGTDGKAELWALTRFLDVARGYVKKQQYKWCSIAADLAATHPVTAKNVGMVLSSIALTNTPFIEGMVPVAAMRRMGLQSVAATHYFYDPAKDGEEAVGMFKALFGLPVLSEAPAILVEIAKVKGWVEDPPVGIDMEHIIGSMKTILNLPTTAIATEVLDNAAEMVQRLVDGTSDDDEPEPAAEDEPKTSTVTGGKAMKDMIKVLAGKLGVRENEDAVIDAAGELIELRTALKGLLKLSRDGNKFILEAVEEAVSDKVGTSDKLSALLKALGVTDADDAVAKLGDTLKKAKELETIMPELTELREGKKEAETKAEEAEVDAVMTSKGYPAELKDSLLLSRRSDPKKFQERYGADIKAAQKRAAAGTTVKQVPSRSALTRQVAARPGGSQVSLGAHLKVEGEEPQQLEGDVIDLSAFAGNNTQKVEAFLASKNPGWDKMSRDQRFNTILSFKRKHAQTIVYG